MRAGTLRHRIQVQAQQETRDAHGGVTRQWVTQATRWGAVKPLSGREFFSAQAVQSDVTHEIRMRHYDGLTTTNRLLHDSRTFEIKSVLNTDERNIETVAMCTEVTG